MASFWTAGWHLSQIAVLMHSELVRFTQGRLCRDRDRSGAGLAQAGWTTGSAGDEPVQ